MPRELTLEEARRACYGGLVMGAGGGGLERGLKAVEDVFAAGTPTMVTLDEVEDDHHIVVMNGGGAPGVGQTRTLATNEDSARASDLLLEARDGVALSPRT